MNEERQRDEAINEKNKGSEMFVPLDWSSITSSEFKNKTDWTLKEAARKMIDTATLEFWKRSGWKYEVPSKAGGEIAGSSSRSRGSRESTLHAS